MSESEVTVNYTLPMAPVDVGKETIGVLDFGQSGRPYRTFANPEIETFFELSVITPPSFQRRYAYGHL